VSTLHWRLTADDVTTFAQADYGLPTDSAVAGDWDVDGTTTIGVTRADPNTGALHWYTTDNDATPSTQTFDYGLAGDQAVAGAWTGVRG
jgi:hypothetical protein